MSIPICTAKLSLGFLLVALFLAHASHAATSVPCGGTTGTPCQGPVIASWFGATCGSSQMNLTMLHQGSTAGQCVDVGFSGFERFSCDPNGLYVLEHWKDKNNTNCQGTPSYVSRITVGDCVDDLNAFTSFSYFCSVAGSASPTKRRRSPPTLPSLNYDATCADVDVCIGAQVWRTSFKDSRCSQVNATSSSLLLPPTIRLNQCYLGTTTLPTISTLYVTCDTQYIYSVNFISDACSGNPLVTNAQPHSICITDQWGESYMDHCIIPPPGIDGTALTGLVEPINDAAVISFSILGLVAIAAFLLVL